MALGEFDLIRRFFASANLNFARAHVALGQGDDAAILSVPAGYQLVMSIDTLNESVHFPPDADPFLLAQRCLLVNLSDLAAMGAEPLAFTLAISLPRADEHWLQAFSHGLAQVASACQCPLVGGDTTRGPLSITIQVHGLVPAGQALLRSGARAGDAVYVTGDLGEAGAALWWLMQDARLLRQHLDHSGEQALLRAFYQPDARVNAGVALRGLASAALDISDGLVSDLQHILDASGGLGAVLDTQSVPVSAVVRTCIPESEQLRLALSAGDDYELCVCIPPQNEAAAITSMAALGVKFTRVGQLRAGQGIVLQWPDGRVQAPAWQGYAHFAQADDATLTRVD